VAASGFAGASLTALGDVEEVVVVGRGEGERREARSMAMVDVGEAGGRGRCGGWRAFSCVVFCVGERIGEIGVAYPVMRRHGSMARRHCLSLYFVGITCTFLHKFSFKNLTNIIIVQL
jgi:hypothetical protein